MKNSESSARRRLFPESMMDYNIIVRGLKKPLLVLWCLLSLAWLWEVAHLCNLQSAFDTYKTYFRYLAHIQHGDATSYEKKYYLAYDQYLSSAAQRIAAFMVMGLGGPGLLLAGGTWLLRTRGKPPRGKK